MREAASSRRQPGNVASDRTRNDSAPPIRHLERPLPYLIEIASVIRSKNAGPLTLSLDILFQNEASYRHAVESPALTSASIAKLYGLAEADVTVLPYAAARAIKIAMPRWTVAGSPGDRDVYGAQQHAPLLGVEL